MEVSPWRRFGRGAALGFCVVVGARLFEEAVGSLPPWLMGCLALAPFWLALLWLFVGRREDAPSMVMQCVEWLGWAGLALYAVSIALLSTWTVPLPG